jgi:hypothetical protein
MEAAADQQFPFTNMVIIIFTMRQRIVSTFRKRCQAHNNKGYQFTSVMVGTLALLQSPYACLHRRGSPTTTTTTAPPRSYKVAQVLFADATMMMMMMLMLMVVPMVMAHHGLLLPA